MDPDVFVTVVFSSFVAFAALVLAVVVAVGGKRGDRRRDSKNGRPDHAAAATGRGRSNEHA